VKPAHLLAVLALLLAAHAAWGTCETDGIVLFPRPGAVIPVNAEFILEGRGIEAARVQGLLGKALFLKNEKGHAVQLDVRRGWQSEMGRTAVRLVPKGALSAEDRYTLILGSELPGYRNLDRRAAATPSWRTGPGPDKARPKWERMPAVAEGRYTVSDDRLTREVHVNAPLKDDSPTYLVVTLRRARGSTLLQTYFAPVDGSTAVLGHDGCSGAFVFEDGRAYSARVEAYDVAGNRQPVPKPVEFHAPRPPGKRGK
jgi:hypothetical protein